MSTGLPDLPPLVARLGETIRNIDQLQPSDYDPALQYRPSSLETKGSDWTMTGTSTDTGGHNDVDDDSDSD